MLAGKSIYKNTGQHKSDSSFRPRLAVSTQALSENAQRERHQAEYVPKGELS